MIKIIKEDFTTNEKGQQPIAFGTFDKEEMFSLLDDMWDMLNHIEIHLEGLSTKVERLSRK